ncbi:MAG: hypothetical protein WCE79_16470 [Xanthobacteraceae bacterium]
MFENSELPEDAQKKLDAIVDLFRSPPSINFENNGLREITYSFPSIRSRSRPSPVTSLGELGQFYSGAEQKFFYQTFFQAATADDLCWPNERLTNDGMFHRIDGSASHIANKVNATKEMAIAWFRDDLIQRISTAKQPVCALMLGLPGSGKSTLVKYLVNAERNYSNSLNVVFTRFESTKFFRFCEEHPSRRGQEWTLDVNTVEMLSDYLYSIVLRDLILNQAYDFGKGGLQRKTNEGFFRSRSSIENLIYQSAEGYPNITEDIIQHGYYTLLHSIGETKFDHKKIFELNFALRVELVRTLARDKKICVVFDGLDFLSPEDELLDRQKYLLLEAILRMFGLGVAGWGGRTARLVFDYHALVLLRPNTFHQVYDRVDKEVLTAAILVCEIAQLDPKVVLYRAIVRGLREVQSYRATTPAQQARTAEELYNCLNAILEMVGLQLQLQELKYSILELFNGNIRDSFKFISRVLYWVREEGERALSVRPKLSEVIEFLSSGDSQKTLRQKSYRVVELLLLFNSMAFQNAITTRPVRPQPARKLNPVEGVSLEKNTGTTSLVDNVFNYHFFEHENNNDNHKLLEKIRLLQLCAQTEGLTETTLMEGLQNLGYDTSSASGVKYSILVLRHAGFIGRDDNGAERSYSVTPKGRIVLERLLFDNIYLEHVYHKTLFPLSLIGSHHDAPRQESHERWTIASIRNYFTLLTYVKFIEANVARHKRVPESFLIANKMGKAIEEAVTRILIQDYLSKQRQNPSTWFLTSALEAMEAQVTHWRSEGLVG